MNKLFTILILMFCTNASAIDYKDLSDDDWASLWLEATNGTSSQQVFYGTIIQVIDRKNQSIWLFTKEGDPLHPSIVRREVISEDGAVSIKTKGWTSADRNLFEDWLKAFDEQDKQIGQQMQSK